MIPSYSDKGTMRAHELMIYCIVRGLKPKAILEIGVGPGVSTLAMCGAIEDGKMEVDYHCCEIVGGRCVEVQAKTKVPLNFHIMTSDCLAKEWNKTIDILFIDGYHEYTQVQRDYFNFSKFVRQDGFIFLHDTHPPSEKYTSVKYCWDAYKILGDLKEDKTIEFITIPYEYGLTICRKLK